MAVEKCKNFLKKCVDKVCNVWYSIKVAAENSATQWTLIIEQYINQPESSKDTKYSSLESALIKNEQPNSKFRANGKLSQIFWQEKL